MYENLINMHSIKICLCSLECYAPSKFIYVIVQCALYRVFFSLKRVQTNFTNNNDYFLDYLERL